MKRQIWHKFDHEGKKDRWCAWDSNSGRQDGRRGRIHWAMAAPQLRKYSIGGPTDSGLPKSFLFECHENKNSSRAKFEP